MRKVAYAFSCLGWVLSFFYTVTTVLNIVNNLTNTS